MGRLGPALLAAAIAALVAMPSAAGSAPRAHTADTSTAFTLLPGTGTSSKRTYAFKKGTAYTITVSGTITSHDPSTNDTCMHDAFYVNCSPNPAVPWSSSAGLDVTEHGTTLGGVPPGNPGATVTFNSSNTYTWQVPKTWFTGDQKLDFWAWPYGSPNTPTTTYSGSFTMTIVAHEAESQKGCKAPWAASDRPASSRKAHQANILEVHVICVQPDVQFHKGGTPADAWLPMEVDTVLKAGDEITCDPDGAATLAFADNSTVVVSNTTQLKIGSFFTEGGIVKTEILLKMGEVAAQVNKSEATKSDFRIKSPTGTISVRGTIFTVFYDPGSGTTLVSAQRGLVRVTPANHRLKAVSIRAGREVEFTHGSESAVARIGEAGARGGVDVLKARDLVTAVIAKHNRACLTITPRFNAFAMRPIRGGWSVAVKLIGALHGTSKWTVVGGKVKATNAVAKTLVRSCR